MLTSKFPLRSFFHCSPFFAVFDHCRWFSSFSVFRHLVVNIICIVYTSYLDLLCRFYHQGRCNTRHSATRSNMLLINKKFTLVVTVRGSPSPHHLSCLFSVTKTKNFWPLKLINVHILVLVAQLDYHLYFNIQKTEKYSTEMCYLVSDCCWCLGE